MGSFWALPVGVRNFGRLCARWPRVSVKAPMLWVLVFVLAGSGRSPAFHIRRHWPDSRARWIRSEVLPCVDSGVSLAASDAWVAQLASRPWVHGLDDFRMANGELVSCVIVDEAGPQSHWLTPEGVKTRLEGLAAQGYFEEWKCGAVRIYKRGASCLTRIPSCS